MEYFDLIFGAILVFFVILGISKGLFREIFGLVGFLGGIVAGILFAGPVGHWLAERFTSIPFIIFPIMAFLLSFMTVYLLSLMLARWLRSIFEALQLGWLNKLLGGAIGGLKGAVLISLLLLILSMFPIQNYLDPIRQKSYFYTPLQNLLPALYGLFSDRSNDLNRKFEDMFKHGEMKVKKQLAGSILHEGIDSTSVG